MPKAKRKRKDVTVAHRERLADALAKRARFTLECEPEELVIEGNASAIDEQTDREQERWIHDQLRAGNPWAWCCAHVTATFRGIQGHDYLGACSYLSEEDFKRPGGYYDDMVRAACDDLARQLIDAAAAVGALIGKKR